MHRGKLPGYLQPLCYVLTAIFMALSVYNHLDFVGRMTGGVGLEEVATAWPVLFLGGAAPILALSAVMAIGKPQVAAKLALIGLSIGFLYYLLVSCSLFAMVATNAFLAPMAILVVTIPWILLLSSGLISIVILRRTASSGRMLKDT